jgi:hypothetical protein
MSATSPSWTRVSSAGKKSHDSISHELREESRAARGPGPRRQERGARRHGKRAEARKVLPTPCALGCDALQAGVFSALCVCVCECVCMCSLRGVLLGVPVCEPLTRASCRLCVRVTVSILNPEP